MNKTNTILKQVLEKVDPAKQELDKINGLVKEFISKFEKHSKEKGVEVFVGGSFAKSTVVKKDPYDVDIFVRFSKESKDLSYETERILKRFVKKFIKIHGSRDYFRIQQGPKFYLEVIPVKKIKNPKQAENITDLSYSHVNYVKRRIKKDLFDDIKLAKSFCHAHNCYGAESYIKGFSGYALELLIYHYKGFMKFIKAMSKVEDKLVIDIEKHYKNKQIVLMDVNSSKLQAPIVLIDPTFKQRNVTAALSEETFKKFQKVCKVFLKSPSAKYFEIQKTDLEKIKNNAKKNKHEFLLLEAKTNKQEGDVAGSKLLKFHNHLEKEISKFFEIKKKGFNYNDKKSARYFFVVKPKKEIIYQGPSIKDKKNLARFKKEHKKVLVKKGRVFAKEKIDFSLKEFISKWKLKHKKKMKDMSIEELKIKN